MPSVGSSEPNLQLIHLGAVSLAHNGGQYSVRGRVVFDFRDEQRNLHSFRLHPERPPASPAAAPTAIDVFLAGKWRAGAKLIRKLSLVQIDCALVRRSADPLINPLSLEMKDPMPSNCHATHAAIHMLDDDCVPVATLLYRELTSGFTVPRTPSAPTPAPWASTRRTPRPSRASTGSTGRGHIYTPIAELWDRTEHSSSRLGRDEKVNVYGVVIDCRAPCTTRGPDLRSEVVVADESSIRDGVDPSNLKTMAIHCFEKNPGDCIPFRSVGDVIRAHRVNYRRYEDHMMGTSTVQGVGRFYSTFLLWSYEGTDFTPVAFREPVRVGNQEHVTARDVADMATPQDREKVSTLRSWARNHLFKVQKVHRPYLRTVLEVSGAHSTADFLSKSFDLICLVEADLPDETDQGVLKFVISDGLLDINGRKERLLVESIVSPDHLAKAAQHGFVDFCPSWNSRPRTMPAWLLIRDVKATFRGPDRVMQLSVGKKTSTLIWHPNNSPDVLQAKAKYDRAMGRNVAEEIVGGGLMHESNGGVQRTDTAMGVQQGHSRGQPNLLTSGWQVGRQWQPGASSGGSPTPGDQAVSRATNVDQQALNRNRRITQKRSRPDPLLHAEPLASSSPPRRKGPLAGAASEGINGSANGREIGSNQFDETRAKTLQRNIDSNATTISSHPNKRFKVSTIAEMQMAVANGKSAPYRLQASARSCISPRDVRFACRPWCRTCEQFLTVDLNEEKALECLQCSERFFSMGDPKIKWAYSVRLNLEDDSGGRIECWIEGKEAAEFFSEIPATSLLSNTEERKRVSMCLRALLNPKNRLDCCVKPYEYQDEHGVYRIACKLFATALLLEVVSRMHGAGWDCE